MADSSPSKIFKNFSYLIKIFHFYFYLEPCVTNSRQNFIPVSEAVLRNFYVNLQAKRCLLFYLGAPKVRVQNWEYKREQ